MTTTMAGSQAQPPKGQIPDDSFEPSDLGHLLSMNNIIARGSFVRKDGISAQALLHLSNVTGPI